MFQTISDSIYAKILSWLADLISVLTFLFWITGFLGWHSYDVYIKKNFDVNPKISIFQGSTIRLDADFRKNSVSDLTDAKWIFRAKDSEPLEISGVVQNDIELPPTLDGIVDLSFKGKTRDGDFVNGATTFTIVQRKPKKIKPDRKGYKIDDTQVKYLPKDAEVYFVSNVGKIPAVISKIDGETRINSKDNSEIPKYGEKVYLTYSDANKGEQNRATNEWPIAVSISNDLQDEATRKPKK